MRELGPRQQERLRAYIKEYPALAEAALTAMTNVLNVLKGAGDILAEEAEK